MRNTLPTMALLLAAGASCPAIAGDKWNFSKSPPPVGGAIREVRAEFTILDLNDGDFRAFDLDRSLAPSKFLAMDEALCGSFLKAVQSCKNASLLQFPGLTSFERQDVEVHLTKAVAIDLPKIVGQELGYPVFIPQREVVYFGTNLSVNSLADDGGRTVRIRVHYDSSDLAQSGLRAFASLPDMGESPEPIPAAQLRPGPLFNRVKGDFEVAVPAGKSVLCYLDSREDDAVEEGWNLPVLRLIPFVCDLFPATEPAKEKHHTMMLVTARAVPEGGVGPQSEAVAPAIRPLPAALAESAPIAPPIAVAPPTIARVAASVACAEGKPHAEIIAILLERYAAACRAGDAAEAKIIARYCLELDPGCFAGK